MLATVAYGRLQNYFQAQNVFFPHHFHKYEVTTMKFNTYNLYHKQHVGQFWRQTVTWLKAKKSEIVFLSCVIHEPIYAESIQTT